jgi:hypothetical protein
LTDVLNPLRVDINSRLCGVCSFFDFYQFLQKLYAAICIIRLAAGESMTLAQIIFLSVTGIAALVFIVGLIRCKDNMDCDRLW